MSVPKQGKASNREENIELGTDVQKYEVSHENVALQVNGDYCAVSSTDRPLSPEIGDQMSWILNNVNCKVCNCFIPATETSKQRCSCGLIRQKHKTQLNESDTKSWLSDVHTDEIPTDAFGAVSFSEDQQDNGTQAEYIRLSDATSMDRVSILLENVWELKQPDLLVSFLGGNSKEILTVNLKKSIEDGLGNVLKSADTWVITGATETPVTKLIGEGDTIYRPSTQVRAKLKDLDKNHTHFLLVDNGTVKRFGVERKFRALLENYFSDGCKPLPVVNILICGGHSCSVQLKKTITDSLKIPVVVMKGTGGLADVIVETLHLFEEKGKTGLRLLMAIKSCVKSTIGFDIADVKNIDITTTVKQIIEEYRSHLIIFDPKDDPLGLDHAIFEACKAIGLGRSGEEERFNNLQLALLLDEIELARKSISVAGSNTLKKKQFLSQLLTREELDEFKNRDKKDLFKMEFVDRILTDLMEEDYTRCYSDETSYTLQDETEDVKFSPLQQILLWAALNNIVDLVECLWKQDRQNALVNALVLHTIFLRMSENVQFDEFLKKQLLESSKEYEQKALTLLDLFYKENKNSSVDVIKTRIPLWGYKSFLTLAANAKSKQLVAHVTCENYLEEVWRGRSEKSTVKSEFSEIRERLKAIPRQRTRSVVQMRNERYRRHAQDETDGSSEKETSRCLRFLEAIRRFFWFLFLVPKGKLLLHVMIYAIFLGCFGYLVLVKRGKDHTIFLYIVCAVVVALTIDEFRQLIEVRKKTLWWKIFEWSSSVWNILDFLAIVFFAVGFAFSFLDNPKLEKVFFALDLVIFIVKFAQFYRMFETLGPYLVMVYRMMFHMAGFVIVLIIAVLAYGIFMHALLFPNANVSWHILFKILFRPYLLVFGELGINSYSLGSNTTVYGTSKVNEGTEIIVIITMCIYLLVANVLLLNMLIAVFNNIYQETQDHSKMIWRFDKYDMIMEFKHRPCLPIPFSVITNIPRLLFRLCSWRTNWVYIGDPGEIGKRQDLEDFKERCMKTYLRQLKRDTTESTESSLKDVKEKVVRNSQTLVKIEETLGRLERLKEKSKKAVRLWHNSAHAPLTRTIRLSSRLTKKIHKCRR
eukprot:gene3066-3530_t